MRHSLAVLAAVLGVAAGAASAQEARPLSLQDSSDAAEIRVFLPASTLDHPRLYDEMISNAATLMDSFRREAEAAMAEAADDPDYPWNPWSLDYVYEPRYLGPVYASFLINVVAYQGGAHPSLDYEVMTRDLEIGQPVTLFDMLADVSEGAPALVAISDYVTRDIARQKQEMTGEPVDLATADWLDAVAPRPENFERFTLEPAREPGLVAGLTFHFPPYVLGPYAEGPFHVFVPADVFMDELVGYFPQIFGGEAVPMARLSAYENPGTFVFLETPLTDTTVASPLDVAGEAPASWFDGEVAVRVEDLEGNVLGTATATARPDAATAGITSGNTRFQSTVTFEKGEASEGQLVVAPPDGEGAEVSSFVRF